MVLWSSSEAVSPAMLEAKTVSSVSCLLRNARFPRNLCRSPTVQGEHVPSGTGHRHAGSAPGTRTVLPHRWQRSLASTSTRRRCFGPTLDELPEPDRCAVPAEAADGDQVGVAAQVT